MSHKFRNPTFDGREFGGHLKIYNRRPSRKDLLHKKLDVFKCIRLPWFMSNDQWFTIGRFIRTNSLHKTDVFRMRIKRSYCWSDIQDAKICR